MPDIAMCDDHECPNTKICYRYQVIPSEHGQAYGQFKELRVGDRCDFIWPIKQT